MIKGIEIRFGEAVDESFEFCPEFFKGVQGLRCAEVVSRVTVPDSKFI